MSSIRVIMPIPDKDFDTTLAPSLLLLQQPTETAVPWKILTEAGIEVHFATEHGTPAACDPLMLTGVMFGQLGAEKEAIGFYNEMIQSDNFKSPLKWSEMKFMDYDGLLLPGGHAKGVRQYLESEEIRRQVIEFFPHTVEGGSKVCASICHGPIVLARAVDPSTGKSVLHGRKTTALPHYLEQIAYYLSAWKVGDYYRTYPTYVEDEIRGTLEDPESQFQRGPLNLLADRSEAVAFVVRDGNYVSARWPGDSYVWGRAFVEILKSVKK